MKNSLDRSAHAGLSLTRTAFDATLQCLAGCAIGELLGMVLGTGLRLNSGATVALSVALACVSGYGLTLLPLLRSGMAPNQALRWALASDTASIALMEIIDNASMLLIPGAMEAGRSQYSGGVWRFLWCSRA